MTRTVTPGRWTRSRPPYDHDGILVDAMAKDVGAAAGWRRQVTELLVFDGAPDLGSVPQHRRGLPDA